MPIQVMQIVFLNSPTLRSIPNSIMKTIPAGREEDTKSKGGVLVNFVTHIAEWMTNVCLLQIINFSFVFDWSLLSDQTFFEHALDAFPFFPDFYILNTKFYCHERKKSDFNR